jgi:hypothetical protein
VTAADETTGFAFYEKVATDAGRNAAFAFIGLGVIWLLSRLWLGGAKVLFWADATIVALGVAHFMFVTAAGAIAWAGKRSFPLRADQPSWKWLWAGTAARLVEQVLCLTALWLAARVVGYLPYAPPPAPTGAALYSARCAEHLPEFTLGQKSHPTTAQETALCACIWNELGPSGREISERIYAHKESEISEADLGAFAPRFGATVKKCGGMAGVPIQ